jgi:hypothetical protein
VALKNFLILYPGIVPPNKFTSNVAPLLLTQQDLWREVRQCGPSLLFRVRSEQKGAEGDRLTTADTLESCVGVVDSTTRWRAAFRMASVAIGGVRHPGLAAACQKALQFAAGQHPASVLAVQRHMMANELQQIIQAEPKEGQPAPSAYEQSIAYELANLIQADNDYDASWLTPFGRSLNPFSEAESPQAFAARTYGVESYAGAVLLDQAASRLMEKMPQWAFVRMPALVPAGAEQDDS